MESQVDLSSGGDPDKWVGDHRGLSWLSQNLYWQRGPIRALRTPDDVSRFQLKLEGIACHPASGTAIVVRHRLRQARSGTSSTARQEGDLEEEKGGGSHQVLFFGAAYQDPNREASALGASRVLQARSRKGRKGST